MLLKQNIDIRMKKIESILLTKEYVSCDYITISDLLLYDWLSIYN